MTDSRVNDEFWSSRISVVRENTLPSMYKLLKETGRWDLMKLKVKEGSKPHYFWDSDVAKFLEAVCYSLHYMTPEDPLYETFHSWVDELAHMIVLAQQPDGYLNSYFTIVEPEKKLTNITEKHELYCLGHLLEAAIAHFKLTGKTYLLDALCRYLDLICDIFGPEEGKRHGYPGHQEVELAIAKLLDVKWEERYFKLLNYFIEQRGYNDGEFFDQEARGRGIDPYRYILGDSEGAPSWPRPRFYEYYQAETQIRDTKEVKGHAVRQFYFLTGVQRLAQFKDDDSLREAVTLLWNNLASKKMYLHGGIGAVGNWEGFGDEYVLPWEGYSETCASCAMVFCAQAILKDRLDANVALILERALFNDVLGGVSLDGLAYYYDQPICGSKGLKRQDWFVCSCCPPNVARLFNNLEEYVCSKLGDVLAIHYYIGGTYYLEGSKITVKSQYPYYGSLEVSVSEENVAELAIRAPTHAFTINTSDWRLQDGYILFGAKLLSGTIKIDFKMQVETIAPNPKVHANRGCLAVKFGPFVYAIEANGVQSGYSLDDLRLSKHTVFTKVKASLNGCHFWQLKADLNGIELNFVPYFVTGNIHPGEDFRMWVKEL